MGILSEPNSDVDPLVGLAEEYAERYRRGERPALTEYTDRYPALAARIRQLFPALVVMEEFGSVAGPSTDPHAAAGAGAPPRQLGEYRILREVGRGGMGVVYEAVQESLGRHVALKVLPAQNWKDPIHLERFRREARAVARLHHTNIVPVFGVGDADGVHYYAMQFIQGQSLDSVLHELKRLRRARSADTGQSTGDPPAANGRSHRRHALSAGLARGLVSGQFPDAGVTPAEGNAASTPPTGPRATPPFASWGGDGRAASPRPPAPADASGRSELTGQPDAQYFRGVARIGVQAAEALAYAHGQGILHRDIKPGNLLLDTQGAVWVTDFGLAKAEDSEELTSAGDIVGTVRYMAPERFQGHADPRSDVYALGLTLYEMLTLRPAFDYTDRARLIDRITRDRPPAPRTIDPRIPRDLETVVLKAVAKEPGARYPTAAALAEDLGRFLADRPIRARRITWAGHAWRWCRRNPVVAGLLTVVAALLVVTVVVLAVSNARIGGALEQEQRAKDDLVRTLYYQWIAAAADARDKNRFALAEELLDRCPPHLRGWEWHYLKRLPFDSFPTLSADGDIVMRVAFSPDGRLAAVVRRNGWVTVWDARTGARVSHFRAHQKLSRCLVFSPDGRLLASGGEDDRVRLWDPRTGAKVRDFPTGDTVLVALVFSPDGHRVAAADKDRRVWVWDAAGGPAVPPFVDDLLAFGGLEFTADSQRLLTVSAEGAVKDWDLAAGTAVPLFDARFHVAAAMFSTDLRRLALGSEDGTVKVLQADPWREVWTLAAHTGAVPGSSFSADGERLATSADDLTVKVWDLRTGQEALTLYVSRHKCNYLAFSPDGHRLTLGGTDGSVRVLDGTPLDGPGPAGELLTLEGHRNAVTWLAYSPDGRRVASASLDGTARIWDAHSGEPLRTLPAGDVALWAVAYSPDGRRVASASLAGAVRVWDAETGAEVCPPLRGPAGPVYGVAFSLPDGRALATAHNDGTVRVWDADTGHPRATIDAHDHPVMGVAFSPDGALLASAGGKGHEVKFWDWRGDTTRHVKRLEGPNGIIRNPVFSPDGRRLVALTPAPAEVRLWDLASGEWQSVPLPDPGRVYQAMFRPDGRRLAVVHGDQVLILDPSGVAGAIVIRGHTGTLWCAALSPDGTRLATGAGYRGRGEVRIWNAPRSEKQP